MKYADARPKIKSGDLLAFTHLEWDSWYNLKVQVVRMATRSKYSHVATAFIDLERVWILEAVSGGPRIMPLSNALPCDWIPLNAPWRPETQRKAISLLGKKEETYSEMEAVHGFFLDVEPGRDSRWMCAEWVWWIANMDGIDLGQDMTPSGLVQAAQRLGAPIYYVEKEKGHD